MQNPIPHIIQNNTFWVSPERCLFWEEKNTLIIADMHLGKSDNNKKSGIVISQSIYKDNFQRLIAQLYFFKADRLIISGSLTHSTSNKEIDLFIKWRKDFSSLHIDLVKGHHDILADNWYAEAKINVSSWKLPEPPFVFLNDSKAEKKLSEEEKKLYRFTGHNNPGITIKVKGKKALQFPCFYFTTENCVLPSFSRFTGAFKVKPEKGEIVFAMVENTIMQLP